MASLTSSSRRSSSSYRSSSRYSTSSTHRLFVEESPGGPSCLAPFSRHSRSSYGYTAPVGSTLTGRQSSTGGGVRCLGDSYYMSADVSQFEPHDVVVMAYNHHVVIHAQKVLDDGSVSDTFTHKSLFPEDMDPLSVSGTLNPDGTLVVSVHRTTTLGELEALGVPTYRSEAHL
ncbi:hypothetical protein EPR50_G00029040 [Perca flavescens]|uniref:SHSP domain-containing protein n=1 Tax=Perca flavescens TaxID=8167 RepID=A0A484DI93_PERFV|nr:hypothetical protein EPR50_G00029040 [Perca flavescens]